MGAYDEPGNAQPAPLLDVLADRAASGGEGPGLVCDDRALSWRELHEEADRFARGLVARGVTPGTLVVLVLPNRAETVVALFALARIGAVAVPANVFLKQDGLAYVFEQSGATTAVVDDLLLERVRTALEDRVALDLLVVVGATQPATDATIAVSYETVLGGPIAPLPDPGQH